MSRLVRPQTLRGFRDVLPAEMSLQNELVRRIRAVYEHYGYVPLDTPVMELLPTLVGSGGEEADAQIFQLLNPEQQTVGLRFDLTVPFARIIAQYTPDPIKLPFRRYHLGPVFRADDPQPEQGRFRQFTQVDIDVAGTESIAADAEIVAVMVDAFAALDLPRGDADPPFYLRVNNRKLVDAFLAGVGIIEPERCAHVLRVLDKSDRITDRQLAEELRDGRYDRSGDFIPGVGLTGGVVDALLDFVAVTGATRAEVVTALSQRIAPSELSEAALAEATELSAHLEALGVAEESARFDPSLARGLAYYTGTVYEGTLVGGGVGSVVGGGRYDGLVSRFLDEAVPMVGASIGLDRLVTGLRNLDVDLGTGADRVQVLVLVMPGVDAAVSSGIAAQLRAEGIGAELYVGKDQGKVGRQLSYANSLGYRAAVMVGRKELDAGQVTVKDLRAGSEQRADIADREAYRQAGQTGQFSCTREQLPAAVQELLDDGDSGR